MASNPLTKSGGREAPLIFLRLFIEPAEGTVHTKLMCLATVRTDNPNQFICDYAAACVVQIEAGIYAALRDRTQKTQIKAGVISHVE